MRYRKPRYLAYLAGYAALVLMLSWPANAADAVRPYSPTEYDFHSVVPLGFDAIRLEPANRTVYLLASAESADFDGMRRIEQGSMVRVLAADGTPVRHYPDVVRFRVTATTRGPKMSDVDPYPIDSKIALEDYLLGLRFRVKVFRGLKMTELEPDAVRMIGMPAEMPYDERIYEVSFALGRVPLADRLVLEVLSPDGIRLTKFHLEFY